MLDWMSVLPQHKFQPRHFESDTAQRSPLAIALAKVGRARREEEEEEDGGDEDDETPVEKEKDCDKEESSSAVVAAAEI